MAKKRRRSRPKKKKAKKPTAEAARPKAAPKKTVVAKATVAKSGAILTCTAFSLKFNQKSPFTNFSLEAKGALNGIDQGAFVLQTTSIADRAALISSLLSKIAAANGGLNWTFRGNNGLIVED